MDGRGMFPGREYRMGKSVKRTRAKARIQREMATMLGRAGDTANWVELRAKYPGIVKSTFYLYLREVKNGKVAKAHIKRATRKIREVLELESSSPEDRIEALKSTLPAIPSPSYVARNGTARLSFLQRLDNLYGDLDEVKLSTRTEDGKRIRNIKLFLAAVKIESDLLAREQQAIRDIWDIRQMQNWHDTIVNSIREVSPETAQRILDKLRALNTDLGISFAGLRV